MNRDFVTSLWSVQGTKSDVCKKFAYENVGSDQQPEELRLRLIFKETARYKIYVSERYIGIHHIEKRFETVFEHASCVLQLF
jgi:hypothetical protein